MDDVFCVICGLIVWTTKTGKMLLCDNPNCGKGQHLNCCDHIAKLPRRTELFYCEVCRRSSLDNTNTNRESRIVDNPNSAEIANTDNTNTDNPNSAEIANTDNTNSAEIANADNPNSAEIATTDNPNT
jgi:hypothetical protein